MNAEIAKVLSGESDGCIVTGDCLEIMADMPDGCVDAVVTDPPWKATTSRIRLRRPGDGLGVAPCRESTSLAYGDIGFFDPVAIKDSCRVSSADVLVLCGYMELPEVIACVERYRGLFVWHNTRPTPLPGILAKRDAAFIVWGGDVTKVTSKCPFPGCVFSYASLQAGCMATERILNPDGSTAHPAQEPLGLFLDIVKPLGCLILDPYCGIGTTCVAAKKLGRRWIGIEIDPGYAEKARRRVASTPKPLFVEEPPKPTGTPLFGEQQCG